MVSSSVRYASTGSGEWKPVYSSVSGHGSSAGSAGTSGGVGKTSSQRAQSPGGRMNVSMGSGGWLSGSAAGGSHTSRTGSGSKLSIGGSNDRISQPGGSITSSSGSARTNSTGGRVISSSNRSNRSTGSRTGSNKERISVCKMATLSISAAGRERRKDKKTQAQQSQQQQKPAGTSPVVQRWLTTGVGVTSADPEVSDDIKHL
ncbi:uncharacterized transmembrane protein DDB_G0289901-like [Notolabrus celidotus]|uniref:uncharacterized transmembrane protein DDB_G0289901-like n=1 Tax=Notolabrus celidotus TaxID=1203425 RepID=UPI00148F7CEA|nr:uncharacterized transmembrane protein DDB_G0289901-like [Notolabrus celidotus]